MAARAASPALADDLAAIGIRDVRDLAATFAADGPHLRGVTRDTRAMTDDWPVAEWSQVSHVARTRLPDGLFDPTRWPGFAPDLAGDPALQVTMSDNARRWASPAYLAYTNLPE